MSERSRFSEPEPSRRVRLLAGEIRGDLEDAIASAQLIRDELGQGDNSALLAADAVAVIAQTERALALVGVLASEIDASMSVLRSLEASAEPESIRAPNIATAAECVYTRTRDRAKRNGLPCPLSCDYFVDALDAGVRDFFGITVKIISDE